MSPAPRNPKCHPHPPPPPPPSSPKILLFPRSRRTRRKQPKTPVHTHRHIVHPPLLYSYKGKLESLFDRENNDSPIPTLDSLNSSSGPSSCVERKEIVEGREEEVGCGRCIKDGGFQAEKRRFQTEILRAECNFFRLERGFALKKLEKNRIQMETTLRSAVQTLVSGRKHIFEGKDANAVLVEEIEDLTEKLQDLQKSSRINDDEFPKCRNMATKACLVQHRLEKLRQEISCPKELQETNDQSRQSIKYISHDVDIDHSSSSSVSNCKTENYIGDVDLLRKKKTVLSRDTLDRSIEEEYNSYVCSAANNSSVSSSASTSKRADEFLEFSIPSTTQFYQEPILPDNKCSGHCKAVIWRIAEQLIAETEQWSQMQEMLRQVRGEMEELQASREFWESRAHSSAYEIQSLWHVVQEWKERALDYENKAKELRLELSALKEEEEEEGIRKVRAEPPSVTQGVQGCEFRNALNELRIEEVENKGRWANYKDTTPPLSLGKQLANEMKKRMMFHGLKENCSPTCKTPQPPM